MKPSAFKQAVFPLAMVAISAWAARAQQAPDPSVLELGKSVEREMAPGQVHSYQLALTAGQYAEVEVRQRRLDVVLTLFDPNGKKLIEEDGPGGRDGLELLTLVVDVTGTYRLDIHPLEKDAPAGRYIAILKTLRAVTEKDRPLVEARRLLLEAIMLQVKGKYDEAVQLAERGLAIRIEMLGADDLSVAAAHDRLGTIFHRNGEFAKATAAHRQSLEIRKKQLGADHPTTAQSAHNLALDYKVQGDYAQAEPLFRSALASFENAPQPNPQFIATAIDQLATIYQALGDDAKAEPLFHRALEIREKAFGPNDFEVAISLNNFAAFYAHLKQYAKAIEFHERALAIKTKRLGTNHPELAITLDNLAQTYFLQGDYKQAKQGFQRALTILEKINNISVAYDLAHCLNGLAILYQIEGNFAQAESLHLRALNLRERLLGPEHPLVVESLGNLHTLNRERKDVPKAVTYLARRSEIHERIVGHNLLAGSERQKLAYLDPYVGQISQAISLHVQLAPDNAEAKQIAIETLLRRKGRVLDVMADSIARLRRQATPENLVLFDQLAAVRSQLAALTLRGPEYFGPASHRAKLKSLNEQMEKLEAEISARSAEFKSSSQPITLAGIQKAIPLGAALVEFGLYTPFDWQTRKLGPLRYIAYVLSSGGVTSWADLGEAKEIDRAVDAFRLALGSQRRTHVKRHARRIDEKVMRRVRPLLGGARQVFLSPDGALGLIPFAALLDERGRYLVGQYSFSYLTSGRDLLRTSVKSEHESAPLIVADPAFGERSSGVAQSARGIGLPTKDDQPGNFSLDFSRVFFRRLPGTTGEAQALLQILPDAKPLMREKATEEALRQIKSPSILHMATHGFFLKDAPSDSDVSRGLGLADVNTNSAYLGTVSAEALLRSGLALAGANQRRSGSDDGIMTALELAGLDLSGTKLAVLSACNTGVGDVKRAEGVYGLRRALVLAGAETQVISLWPVPDKGTRDLMIAYYQALQRGEGRGEALRHVQLRMLRSGNRRHPYYWASFIQSGEWRSLKRPDPQPQASAAPSIGRLRGRR